MTDKQENSKNLDNPDNNINPVDKEEKTLFSENSEGKKSDVDNKIKSSEQNLENQNDFQKESEKAQPDKETQKSKEIKKTSKELLSKESNYQVSLINENLLRIVVITDKKIGVDCIVKDKKSESGESPQTQSNKILVNPKEDGSKQEVEIIVAINPVESEKIEAPLSSVTSDTQTHKKKLLIDPSVADLVEEQKKRDSLSEYHYIPKTREEYYEERLKPNNPYRKNLKLIEKNLKTGAIVSIIIFILTIIIYSSIAASKQEGENELHQRLIVIQDVPETVNEVPVKEEEKTTSENDKDNIPTNIISRPRTTKIKTPKIVRTEEKRDTTKRDTADITMINKQLDTERKSDTTRTDTSWVRSNIDSTNAKVIYMDYQKYGWQKTDEVTGLRLSNDTTQYLTDRNNRKGGDFDLKIVKDLNGVLFSCKGEAKQFQMKDTSFTAICCGPFKEENLSKKYSYYFQVKNKTNTYAVTVVATINEIYLEEYKAKVDDVVSGMRIPKE